jgi:hypothetical protein
MPAGVAFARASSALAAALAGAGITPSTAVRTGALPPEDLATEAARITTIVGCWNE